MPNDMTDVTLWSNVSRVADVLGVATAVLAGWTFLRVGAIRKGFLARARVPALRTDLSVAASRLSQLAAGMPGTKKHIAVLTQQCGATLRNLQDKVPLGLRFECLRLRWAIRNLRSKDKAWKVYARLIGLVQALDHHQSDADWR
jgi:hypothetical protein